MPECPFGRELFFEGGHSGKERGVRLGSDGGTSTYQQWSKYSSAFSSAGIASMTLVGPIENQLLKVVPELYLNDVLETVAEVEMSSAGFCCGRY